MNSREDYLAVGIRLFTLWLILMLIQQVPILINQFTNGTLNSAATTGYLLVSVFSVCLVLWLWLFPLSIARKFLPVMSEPRSDQGMGADIALTVGITLIGMWAFVDAVISGVYYLAFYIQAQPLMEQGMIPPDNRPYYWMTAVQFALGLVLMLGASGIKTALVRFRYAGAKTLE